MALKTQISEWVDLEELIEAAQTKPFVWLHAPIIVHKRSNNKALCLCGCGRDRVTVDRIEEDIDIIFDRVTGIRKDLAQVEDKAAWHRFANSDLVVKVEAPTRCYEKQYQVIVDDTHKQIGVFGGNRGGKTACGVEWFKRGVFRLGGPGAKFLIVAPTKEKTWVSVRKLVHGERIGRTFVRPVIPPELVAYAPQKHTVQDLVIRLIDGSEIWLRHGDSGAIKGDSFLRALVDEICEIPDHNVWAALLGRLLDSGGQVLAASTPVAGHWAEQDLHIIGKGYDVAQPNDPISTSLTCFDNVWLDPEEVKRSIPPGKEKDPKIRRDFFGEWVPDGWLLWRHYNPELHLRDGQWTDVRGWGLENITPSVARKFFKNTKSPLTYVAGQDFNLNPMGSVVCQIACPPNCDQGNPDNWILFALFEIVEKGTIFEFARYLRDEAGKSFGLDPGFFAALPIACDATGAQPNPTAAHGLTRTGATLAKEMCRQGFDCRPCNRRAAQGGMLSPTNPAQLDRINLMHRLMSDRCPVEGFRHWPRLVVHASRCPKLIQAFELQEADEYGRIKKESNTFSDRISSPSDALNYLAWAMYGRTYQSQTKVLF